MPDPHDRSLILDLLSTAGPLTAREIRDRLSLPVSSAHIHLTALLMTGQLEADDGYPRRYRVAAAQPAPEPLPRAISRRYQPTDTTVEAEAQAGAVRVRVILEGVAPGTDLTGIPGAVSKAARDAVRWAAEREREGR